MSRTPLFRRWFAPLLALSLWIAAGASTSRAATVWSPDYNISGSDVNVSLTPLNSQRFTAVDDSNNLYIAFYDDRNKVSGDDNYEIYFRRFTYGLGSPALTRVTNKYAMSKYPAIATLNWGLGDPGSANDSGRVYIAWQDARLFSLPSQGVDAKSYTIFFRTFQSRGGEGFGPEIQVSVYDSLNAATAPALAVDPAQHVWIVWPRSDGANKELHYAVYDAVTRTMGAEQLLTSGAVNATNPSVAADRFGNVFVVWTDSRAGGLQVWTKRYHPDTGWSADEQLVFSPTLSRNPYITSNYLGHFHLVWQDSRDGNYEIYYKEYTPGTGWDPADTRVTTNTALQGDPQVDSDAGNSLYLVWTDQRNGGAANTDIYYTERHGGVWEPEISLVGAGTDTTNQKQYVPGITHDGVGNLYVAWTDERLPASTGRNKDIYYKQGTGGVTGVDSWSAPPISRLLRNYPNPFNPATRIEFSLDRDTQVTLRVFDVHGRLVRTLMDSYLAAGRREVSWDGRGDRGEALPSGAYFLKLTGGGQSLTRTVNIVK
jgi:hypothetical protein